MSELRLQRLREKLVTHGMTHNRFYRIYRGILDRCTNPKATAFNHYGGRGIKCMWPNFKAFKEDMYESYLAHVATHGERNTTIERKDNEGHYCKQNCKWSTRQQQSMNRRTNRKFTFRGETLSASEWCKKIDLNKPTFYGRLERGWSIERTLSTPRLSQGTNSHPKSP